MKTIPRIFSNFPKDARCPVCGTNEDSETVLLAIDGTAKDRLCEAQPFHLHCAVAEQFNAEMGIVYRRIAINE